MFSTLIFLLYLALCGTNANTLLNIDLIRQMLPTPDILKEVLEKEEYGIKNVMNFYQK